MIYRCFVCSKIKLKNKYIFTLEIRNNKNESVTRFICKSCGEDINSTYETNESFAEGVDSE